ncbi:S-layer homology domain-containing protein [Paenibacillus mucilaginosus]|uniref:AmyB n=1 Tax=Paenibacillus mucilaginosus (strain KNP414) TaxID=1036673 RepID=F8FBC5_PAEMK|nr:S-layer homology domain-containing protein [Paenibacillus mucilaginosus]AEI42092.1 AmyB [Paenibacillus mucilaginosus KNP414]MCG7214078.1 S-layer homology domain-containing protein [Paenibacillus mucilaginosus]WDM28601.1 S-layer homology domain-containing protein [Paenibacillus mucilaginosus]
MKQWMALLLLTLGLGMAGSIGLTSSASAEVPVSQGKKAAASSVTGATYGPARAVDGNMGTYWAPGGSQTPSWLTVDLGQRYEVREVRTAYLERSGIYKYLIEFSSDSQTWYPYASRMKNTTLPAGSGYVDAGNVTARYFRITTSGSTGGKRAITEFQVYGTAADAPPEAELASIEVDETELELQQGDSHGLEVLAVYTDGHTEDVTASATFTSSKPKTASVTAAGVVKAKAEGQAAITVAYGGKKAKVQVTVGAATELEALETNAPQRLGVGETHQLEVTALYDDGTSEAVTTGVKYASFRPSVVSVSSKGVLTARTEGEAVITVSYGGISTKVELTAGAARELQSIGVDAPGQLVVGDVQELTVTAVYSDGSTEELGSGVTFTSSDPAVASISSKGVLRALTEGQTVLTVSYGGKSTTADLTVGDAHTTLDSLSVDVPANLYRGQSYSLTVTAYYADGTSKDVTDEATFTSSSTRIATVSSSGVLKGGNTSGTTTITVSYGGLTYDGSVYVSGSSYNSVSSLSFSPSSFSLNAGGSSYFSLTAYNNSSYYDDDDYSTVVTSSASYTSSNPSVATADTSGYVRGHAAGSATITASYGGTTATAYVTVTGGTDTEDPTWDYGAELTAAESGDTEVTLSWGEASDNVGVTAYKLLKDGTEIQSLSSYTRSYTVSGLTAGQNYTFVVEAADAAGNRSTQLSVTASPGGVTADGTGTGNVLQQQPYEEYDYGTGSGTGYTPAPAGQEQTVTAVMQPETTPDGVVQSKGTVDEAALAQALSGVGTGTVVIQASGAGDSVVVNMPAAPFLNGAAAPGSRVAVQLPEFTGSLPSALLQKAAGSGDGSGQLSVVTRVRTDEASNLAQELAAEEGATLLLPYPVEMKLMSGSVEVTDYEGQYVERTVTLDGAAAGAGGIPSAMWLDPQTGRWGYLPAKTGTAPDGRQTLTVKAPQGGIFTVKAAAKSFADTAAHWAKADIEELAAKGVVTGLDDQRFAPDQAITRAELSVLLVRAIGLEQPAPNGGDTGFRDVGPEAWYAGAVAEAVKAGLIDGYEDGTFRPMLEVTREQAAALFRRAIRFASGEGTAARADAGAVPQEGMQPGMDESFEGEAAAGGAAGGAPVIGGTQGAGSAGALSRFRDGAKVAPWAQEAVAFALQQGFMQGVSERMLQPQANTTRAQATAMLKRLLQHLDF